MPILNDLSKKLSEVAQTTVQVSKELAGSAKATLAISAEEREIEKAYRALGQWYYSTKGENPEEAAEFIETVDTSLRKIREIRQEAEAAKTAASQPVPMIACPACGTMMESAPTAALWPKGLIAPSAALVWSPSLCCAKKRDLSPLFLGEDRAFFVLFFSLFFPGAGYFARIYLIFLKIMVQ